MNALHDAKEYQCPQCGNPLWIKETQTNLGLLWEASCEKSTCKLNELGYGDTRQEANGQLFEKWRKQFQPDDNHLKDHCDQDE